jgi:hypothetical protein
MQGSRLIVRQVFREAKDEAGGAYSTDGVMHSPPASGLGSLFHRDGGRYSNAQSDLAAPFLLQLRQIGVGSLDRVTADQQVEPGFEIRVELVLVVAGVNVEQLGSPLMKPAQFRFSDKATRPPERTWE